MSDKEKQNNTFLPRLETKVPRDRGQWSSQSSSLQSEEEGDDEEHDQSSRRRSSPTRTKERASTVSTVCASASTQRQVSTSSFSREKSKPIRLSLQHHTKRDNQVSRSRRQNKTDTSHTQCYEYEKDMTLEKDKVYPRKEHQTSSRQRRHHQRTRQLKEKDKNKESHRYPLSSNPPAWKISIRTRDRAQTLFHDIQKMFATTNLPFPTQFFEVETGRRWKLILQGDLVDSSQLSKLATLTSTPCGVPIVVKINRRIDAVSEPREVLRLIDQHSQ